MTDTKKTLQRAFNPAIEQWDLITELTPETITFYSGNKVSRDGVTIITEN